MSMSNVELSGQPILILKEGSSKVGGSEALHANVLAVRALAEVLRSSLGPRGMDKMLVDSFGDITVTNDGKAILDEMDVEHPAGKMLVEVAKAQDEEVGDGTTSAAVLTSELLVQAEDLIGKDVHPILIVDGYKRAGEEAVRHLAKVATRVKPLDEGVLRSVVETSLSGKMAAEDAKYLAGLAVRAALKSTVRIGGKLRFELDDVKVEKKRGDSLRDTMLVEGVVLDKEVVHPAMPKRVEGAKVAILGCALEVEKTEYDAKLNIESPEQIEAFMRGEEEMLKGMVERIASSGANVVMCQKGIDDSAQHMLAEENVLAVRRVKQTDMEKIAKATGGRIVTDLDDLAGKDLGWAKWVEERKVGDEKMTFIGGCKDPKSLTILIRGGADRVVDEAERSLHDALSVIRDVIEDPRILPGGGAAEMEAAVRLRTWGRRLHGKEQLAASAFAEALEAIPMTLAENGGMDPIDTVADLRAAHARGKRSLGIDPIGGRLSDMMKMRVYDPHRVREQAIRSATEAACMILKIDDLIAASKSLKPEGRGPGAGEEAGEGPGGEPGGEF